LLERLHGPDEPKEATVIATSPKFAPSTNGCAVTLAQRAAREARRGGTTLARALWIAVPLAFLDAGCAVTVRPPADRVEVIPERPSPRHVWIRGRWVAYGADWRWVEGRWEVR
jgi:hypothetical protein